MNRYRASFDVHGVRVGLYERCRETANFTWDMTYRPLFTYMQAFFDIYIGLFPRVYRPLFTYVLGSFDVGMCRTVRALEGQVESSDPARG